MISPWLMPSTVCVWRSLATTVDGVLTASWSPVSGLESVRCRIEVGFYRPGRDAPLPVQAGRAPDRPAVYWVAPGTDLRPGDRMECIAGPVIGTWEIRTVPDTALNMKHLHHLEGQCIETNPAFVGGMQQQETT